MILKRILLLSFVFISSSTLISQNNVCVSSSSSDDLLMELNTIDKCLNEKEDVKEELPKVKNNRYLRNRKNSYYSSLRKNLKTISITKTKILPKKVKDVYLGEVTQEPTFLEANDNLQYKGSLKEVLEAYVNDHLEYPSALEHNGIEGIVWTSFVIDSNGDVKNIVTLGPINGELFEIEAAKVIKSLPKFKPGKMDDELVNVKHLMAIKFEINK